MMTLSESEANQIRPFFTDFVDANLEDNKAIYNRRKNLWYEAEKIINERRALNDEADALNASNNGERELELMRSSNSDLRSQINAHREEMNLHALG